MPVARWYRKFGAVIFIVFTFEVGVFLAVFPWMESWDTNWVPTLAPWVREVWMNPYVRGGLSGLGLVDVYISFLEIFRMRRFSAS